MLAAGLGLGLVVGLAGLTSTLVTALHVGSERLLAGFDALSGVSHARAPEESADSMLCLGPLTLKLLRSRRIHGLKSKGSCCETLCALFP